jgi:hemerythrin superfamily protein
MPAFLHYLQYCNKFESLGTGVIKGGHADQQSQKVKYFYQDVTSHSYTQSGSVFVQHNIRILRIYLT